MPAIAAPPVIIEAFAVNGARNVIPVASQIAITPGAASYNDGFPPLCMTEGDAGGVPPDGLDMNGILYAISAHAAWQQAGGFYVWNTAVAGAGGYPLGAVLRSASDLTKGWYNTTANNTNNPDVTPTGWTTFSILGGGGGSGGTVKQSSTLGAGTTNDLAITPTTTGFLDITPNAAGSDLTGLAGGTDGQPIIITNVHASNVLTLKALTGSSAGNQFRLGYDLTLPQYSGKSFRYSSTLAVWVPA